MITDFRNSNKTKKAEECNHQNIMTKTTKIRIQIQMKVMTPQ